VFGHFTTISDHFFATYLLIYLSQNLTSDGHFEGFNLSKSQLDQNLWHKIQSPLTSVFFKFGRKKMKIYVSKMALF
jgi:hypothetical protein